MKFSYKKILNFYIIFWLLITNTQSSSKSPELQNFSSFEEKDISQALNTLYSCNTKRLSFRKQALSEDILGQAYVFSYYCYIELSPQIFNSEYFLTVLYHEFAHCQGIVHSPNPNSIMYKYAKPFNEYTTYELNQYLSQFTSCH